MTVSFRTSPETNSFSREQIKNNFIDNTSWFLNNPPSTTESGGRDSSFVETSSSLSSKSGYALTDLRNVNEEKFRLDDSAGVHSPTTTAPDSSFERSPVSKEQTDTSFDDISSWFLKEAESWNWECSSVGPSSSPLSGIDLINENEEEFPWNDVSSSSIESRASTVSYTRSPERNTTSRELKQIENNFAYCSPNEPPSNKDSWNRESSSVIPSDTLSFHSNADDLLNQYKESFSLNITPTSPDFTPYYPIMSSGSHIYSQTHYAESEKHQNNGGVTYPFLPVINYGYQMTNSFAPCIPYSLQSQTMPGYDQRSFYFNSSVQCQIQRCHPQPYLAYSEGLHQPSAIKESIVKESSDIVKNAPIAPTKKRKRSHFTESSVLPTKRASGESIACKLCDHLLTSRSIVKLVNHLGKHYARTRRFGCATCAFTATMSTGLHRHITMKHENGGDWIDLRGNQLYGYWREAFPVCFPDHMDELESFIIECDTRTTATKIFVPPRFASHTSTKVSKT